MGPALDEGAPCRKEWARRRRAANAAVQASKFETCGVFEGFDALCAKPYANARQQQETPCDKQAALKGRIDRIHKE
jgi:hypothetical protein